MNTLIERLSRILRNAGNQAAGDNLTHVEPSFTEIYPAIEVQHAQASSRRIRSAASNFGRVPTGDTREQQLDSGGRVPNYKTRGMK